MKLLALCGRPRAGKNAVAALVEEMVAGSVTLNFSQPIIEECAAALRIPESEINADKEHYRPFLQWYGFEHKRREDPAYWVKRIEQRVEEARKAGAAMVVICGVRALNEWEMVIRHGGVVYEVVRPEMEWTPAMDHPCEKQRIPVSGRIKNFDTMEVLRKRVRRVVERIMAEEKPATMPAIGMSSF